MTTDERKEMYTKVKQGLIDFGGNEEVDTGRDKDKSRKGQKEKGQGRLCDQRRRLRRPQESRQDRRRKR